MFLHARCAMQLMPVMLQARRACHFSDAAAAAVLRQRRAMLLR